MRKNLIFTLVMSLALGIEAQYTDNPYKASIGEARIKAAKAKASLFDSSHLTGLIANSIGPTVMSGRVVEIAVDPVNTAHFYVAYATGGIWETFNSGITFKPVFDNNRFTIHIGCLTVDWDRNRIFVGTGESNSSRSSYAGYGLFMSEDNGKTWKHLGLEETHHIAKVIPDYSDGNTIWVATMGHLYSPNEERGVYKSRDGGKTWERMLFIDQTTGVIDMIMDPRNPYRVVAATWQKDRRAWDFTESGDQSGIYITGDGGRNWSKAEDFPSGAHVGRIGLALSTEGTLYALLDNQETYEKEDPIQPGVISKKSFKTMSKDEFAKLAEEDLDLFLKSNRFPNGLNAKKVKKMVASGDLKPIDLYHYLTDSNAALFEVPVKGAELYRSNDFGRTWTKTHEGILENVCYSYGYYFGTLAVGVVENHIYIAGVPLLFSKDGGKTFEFIGGDNVHVDHHHIWVNPANPKHIINGNDGGVNITYDGGKSWIKCNSPAVGQFYTVNVDNSKPYNVYGGLQDNGVWIGPSTYEYSDRWHAEGKYPYQRLLGGDGMKVEIDEKNNYIYTGYQFGHYYRIDRNTGKRLYIHPMQELKDEPYRWNWQTPLVVSKHKPKVVYMGSNHFHRSTKSGADFKTLSDDLTKGAKQGNVSYGTLTCIEESPLKFGLLYVGSDDGLIHISSNGGKSWVNISKGLPADLWVSRILASKYDINKVYICLNGYRWDNFEAYIYVSDNQGQTWKRMETNLPLESINVLLEDPVKENMLYVGTDGGVYVSYNKGSQFEPLSDMPPVAVHDMVIQESADELIIGTHGRSLYKLNLGFVRDYQTIKSNKIWLAKISPVKYRGSWGSRGYNWDYIQLELQLTVFKESDAPFEILVQDKDGKELLKEVWEGKAGFVQDTLALAFPNEGTDTRAGDDGMYYPLPGTFKVIVRLAGEEFSQELKVKK